MMDDPYNFVDEDDSMQKPLQGPPMHPFPPNGYNMSQSSQQHQSIDYSNSLATQQQQQQPSSVAPTPDKNAKKRGRKKKGDEIRYVDV